MLPLAGLVAVNWIRDFRELREQWDRGTGREVASHLCEKHLSEGGWINLTASSIGQQANCYPKTKNLAQMGFEIFQIGLN